MFIKHPIDPARTRKAPPHGFGWIDHRLLREGHIGRASVEALALYLLLACASDADGLSFYSDARTSQLLGLERTAVGRARRELIRLGLILYRPPLYQLLNLAEVSGTARASEPRRRLSPAQPRAAISRPPVGPSESANAAPPRVFPLRAAVERLLSKGDAA